MTSTKPYLRKRAVLLLYKVFLNNPDALKPAFPRLREKLEDPDPGLITKKNPPKIYFLLLFFRCTGSSC